MEYNNLNDIYEKFFELKNNNFKTEKDALSNIIFRSEGTGKRILVYPIFDIKRLLVKKVNKKEAEAEAFGYTDKSVLKDKEVFCNENSVGIIREKKDNEDKPEYFVELWEENSANEGDWLNTKMYTNCKDNILYSNNINLEIARYLWDYLSNKEFNSVNGIYFTVVLDANSAISIANRIDADVIIPVYAAKAGDGFEQEKGCGYVLKDGGFVLRDEQRKFFENNYLGSHCGTQKFIGSQCPSVERLSLLCRGIIFPIAIPTKHLGSSAEIVNRKDIDSAAELIYNILNTEV